MLAGTWDSAPELPALSTLVKYGCDTTSKLPFIQTNLEKRSFVPKLCALESPGNSKNSKPLLHPGSLSQRGIGVLEAHWRLQCPGKLGNHRLTVLEWGSFHRQHQPPCGLRSSQSSSTEGSPLLSCCALSVSMSFFGQAVEGLSHLMLCFVFQPKERGSTRVHALNNVNRVLQVLHQNNVSWSGDLGALGCHRDYSLLKLATCSVHGYQLIYGNIFLMRSFELFL